MLTEDKQALLHQTSLAASAKASMSVARSKKTLPRSRESMDFAPWDWRGSTKVRAAHRERSRPWQARTASLVSTEAALCCASCMRDVCLCVDNAILLYSSLLPNVNIWKQLLMPKKPISLLGGCDDTLVQDCHATEEMGAEMACAGGFE